MKSQISSAALVEIEIAILTERDAGENGKFHFGFGRKDADREPYGQDNHPGEKGRAARENRG